MELSLIPAIIWSSITTAVACSLIGSFLMLRGMSMMSEAISHAMLPGLVLGLMILGPLGSPQLVLGPAILGLFMVLLIELLGRSRLLAGDSPLGLVYPLLFSIGVILVSRRFAGLPITENSVLIGDINFAAATPIYFRDTLLGPRPLVVMGGVLVFNLIFVSLFFKELAITTFDPALARASGFQPALIHYSLMTLVSITIVGAFEAVGAVLVVALLIGPPASAYLLTRRLSTMVATSAFIGALTAWLGFELAYVTDSATSGTMAMVIGVVFLFTFVFSPRRGVLVSAVKHRRNRYRFTDQMLLLCLAHHGGGQSQPTGPPFSNSANLADHIGWTHDYTEAVLRRCIARKFVTHHHGVFLLTPAGKKQLERLARSVEAQTSPANEASI